MKEQNESKERRMRRTNLVIDRNIDEAVKKLVSEVGFSNLTLKAIAEEATVDPPVIYNKYGNLNGLLREFIQQYENWLTHIEAKSIRNFQTGKYQRFLTLLLKNTAKRVNADRVIQELLIWEVQEKSDMTRQSARMREANTFLFSSFYSDYFEGTGVDFNMFMALISAGIYYLIMRKDVLPFCEIDLNKKEDFDRMLDMIEKLIEWIFSERKADQKMEDVAIRLKQKGIDVAVIAEATGLSVEHINELS
jgi:AcrR family transcriptional regulator